MQRAPEKPPAYRCCSGYPRDGGKKATDAVGGKTIVTQRR
jgi:hypothetical protein